MAAQSLLAAAALAGALTCGTEPGLGRELILRHVARAALPSPRPVARATSPRAAGPQDVVLVEDRQDVILRRNAFDLDGAGLRFMPAGPEAYAVTRVDRPVETATATLALDADGAQPVDLPFSFAFYGAPHGRAFVHADGTLTFERADAGPGYRGLGRFVDGPPRVAALLADLDPPRGGSVGVRLEAARAVFVWRAVPGATQINANTFSITLHADGAIDLAWERVETREVLVGVTPGRGRPVTQADLGRGAPAAGALVERFNEAEELDLVATVRRVLAERGDGFDQLVLYTTRPLNPFPGTLAFQVNVRNAIRGIGLDVADDSRDWGSGGVLESVVYMDAVDTFRDHDAFEFLGHEVGHRWLARARHRAAGGASGALLGRGAVHWSFFLDSDASVMEGNEIEDLGGGRFRTTDIARRFSPLDQYLMGLRPPEEVPPFFHVEAPDEFRPDRPYKPSSGPESGVTFSGSRRDVTVADVIAALGPREPAAGPSPPWRVAFVLVADDQAPATPDRLAVVDRIRARFEPWYVEATAGRGRARTTVGVGGQVLH
ncbi:MAG TPA: hypothetical protein VFM29_08710 [Vicinamibacteria bacterium]|nr:hypothetical protein [Vicinamibacteria bacterium]